MYCKCCNHWFAYPKDGKWGRFCWHFACQLKLHGQGEFGLLYHRQITAKIKINSKISFGRGFCYWFYIWVLLEVNCAWSISDPWYLEINTMNNVYLVFHRPSHTAHVCQSGSGFHRSLHTRNVYSSCWGHHSATWGQIWHKCPLLWVAGKCLQL